MSAVQTMARESEGARNTSDHQLIFFAVEVSRRLRFYEVLTDYRPAVTYLATRKGRRVFVFRTGDERDRFIEEFHGSFGAHATREYHGQEKKVFNYLDYRKDQRQKTETSRKTKRRTRRRRY